MFIGKWDAAFSKQFIRSADFICFDKIIIELKVVKEIAPEHKAQLLNYLKATGLELGLLVNFGAYQRWSPKIGQCDKVGRHTLTKEEHP